MLNVFVSSSYCLITLRGCEKLIIDLNFFPTLKDLQKFQKFRILVFRIRNFRILVQNFIVRIWTPPFYLIKKPENNGFILARP